MKLSRRVLTFVVVAISLIDRGLSAQDRTEAALNRFEPPVRLKAGTEFIDTGKYIAHSGPITRDLDADGKPDLLVGNFRGHFQVYMNIGTRTEPRYEDKGLLEAEGQTAKVPNWWCIGLGPQFADLTGDSIDDLFTGCFEGGIYVLPGSKDGKFKAPQKLLDKSGNVLRLGQYWDYDAKKWTGVAESKYKDKLGIGATAVDWDDDGDVDLLLGGYDGTLFIRLNEGNSANPAWSTESIQLAKGDTPLEVPGRDAIPKIADWDGDGRFDILSGSGEGGVYWLRNVGTKGAPAFDLPEEIIPPAPAAGDRANPNRLGERTQVYVTDYDGDKDLDLLVGDYHGGDKEMHGWVWLFRRLWGSLRSTVVASQVSTSNGARLPPAPINRHFD
jgi:hypothetical protein